jgi:hypothetical protein
MGEMETSISELGFWDWVGRVTEKLTFARLNVNDHREISDDDYTLLKILFRPYYNGEYPLYQSKMEGIVESVTQNSLFTDGLAEESTTITDGTIFDTVVTETIKEEEDEKQI